MLEETRYDAQIAALYKAGTNAIEIARRLEIRVPEVIGRIRALDLKPLGMAERRPAALAEAAPALAAAAASVAPSAPLPAAEAPLAGSTSVATASSGVPVAAAGPRPMAARPRLPGPARPGATRSDLRGGPLRVQRGTLPGTRMAPQLAGGRDLDDDDDDDCDVVRIAGRPKGWLVSEARMREMYARMGGRY
jgi:hypothetical protein